MFQLPDQVPRSDAACGSPNSDPAPGILVDSRRSRPREPKPSSRKTKSAPLLSIPVVPPQLAAVVPLQSRSRLAKVPRKPFPGNQFTPVIFSSAVSLVFLLGLTLTSLYFCQAQPIEDRHSQILETKLPVPERILIREEPLPEPVTPSSKPEGSAENNVPPPPPPTVEENSNDPASATSSVEEIKIAKLDPPKEPLVEKQTEPPPKVCGSPIGDDKCGTAVNFVASPKLAEEHAAKQKKLVFVLHVSGNFEDPGFTWNNAEALRVNALANPKVGDYLNKYFVSSFQKVGTFRINGNQKQGGNVASYFCTPDGRVLHAIAGPVNAETMLREAQWIVETCKMIDMLGPMSFKLRQTMFRDAHLIRLKKEHHVTVNRAYLPYYDAPDAVAPIDHHVFKRFKGNISGSNPVRVHQILAAHPLARLSRVYTVVFEDILNETVSISPVVVQK